MDESVLKGNSAILKCVIPSFVGDFVSVEAWVDADGRNYYPSDNYGRNMTTGYNLFKMNDFIMNITFLCNIFRCIL